MVYLQQSWNQGFLEKFRGHTLGTEGRMPSGRLMLHTAVPRFVPQFCFQFQLPANGYAVRQPGLAMWETWVEFRVPGFDLVHHWLLWPFGE